MSLQNAQPAFARLNLYEYLTNDDDDEAQAPEHITLLGNITDKGMLYYVFSFKSGDNTDIAIAGPYKAGSMQLNFEKYWCYTDYSTKNSNWQLQARKMIPKLKIQYANH